jgi:hypothetical protein
MEPASLLLRFIGEKITVTYDLGNGSLKQYEGVSNIRDETGDNYRVRVEFRGAAGP